MMTIFSSKFGKHLTVDQELEECTNAAKELLSDVFDLSSTQENAIPSGKMMEMMDNIHILYDLVEAVKKEKSATKHRRDFQRIPRSPRYFQIPRSASSRASRMVRTSRYE